MAQQRSYAVGFALAAVGAMLFSAKAVVAKLLYLEGTNALEVIGFRMLLSLPIFAVVAVFYMWRVRRGQERALSHLQRGQVVLLGFIGYYLASYLDFLGLQYISASLERLILFLSPTFIILFTAIFLRTRIAAKQWLALLCAYAGVGMVFLQDLSFSGDNVSLGALLVLGSSISYSVYIVSSGELLKKIGSTRLVAYAMSVSSLFILLHFFVVEGTQGLWQSNKVYALSLLHAWANTAVPTFMVMWAVERIGAPLTAQVGLVGPVSVLFLANVFLGEPITVLQLGGTGLVLWSMVWLRKPQ